ncbi:MAG: hypothetical protein QOD27_631 [Microbacteriaceae bacterium]|nr:hypothetical protein [Microbacteriaceae bacterium]
MKAIVQDNYLVIAGGGGGGRWFGGVDRQLRALMLHAGTVRGKSVISVIA